MKKNGIGKLDPVSNKQEPFQIKEGKGVGKARDITCGRRLLSVRRQGVFKNVLF